MLQLLVKGAPSGHCDLSLCSNIFDSFCVVSNLTFGTGGKDEQGENVAGWGYYEVCFLVMYFSCSKYFLDRRLLEVQVPGMAGMVRTAYILTLPIHALVMLKFWSDDIP